MRNGRRFYRRSERFFCVLFLFYQFKQCCYYLLGSVFSDPDKYKLWKTSYNAIMGIWGVSLYVPVLWLVFVGTYVTIPIVMFCILYILCRFVIIYKTIRIFHKKSTGLLYISLYLCGQEILPLVFLYEGMVYCITLSRQVLYGIEHQKGCWYHNRSLHPRSPRISTLQRSMELRLTSVHSLK